ncbi:Pam3-gp28 family putative phage holin [Afipia felis]|nr:hypothetical protein [Afipia felis]
MIWQVIHYALLLFFGYLTKKGFGDADTWNAPLGPLGALFTAGWGIYVKFNTKAVPTSVAARPDVPTVSAATGAKTS